MTDPRTREELLAEIERLEQVNQRWAQSWQSIVTANTEAWTDNVRLLWRAAAALGVVLDTAPNVKVVEAPQFSEAFVNASLAYAALPIMFKTAPPENF